MPLRYGSKIGIIEEFNCKEGTINIINNGLNTNEFIPIKEIKRLPFRLITTASADVPLKGLDYSLKALEILKKEYEVLLMGDFNVIPDDEDAHDIKKYKNDALAQPESRKEFYKLINLDLIDVFKTTPKKQSYTFFDYKTYKFGKEEGIRIDFFLLSPFLKSKIMKLKVLKEYRDMDRPSDHCPILIDLNI